MQPSANPATKEATSSASVKLPATARETRATDSDRAKMLRAKLVESIRSSDSRDTDGTLGSTIGKNVRKILLGRHMV